MIMEGSGRTGSCVLKNYHKILKISPGAYIFQRPLRGSLLEDLLYGGSFHFQIDWASLTD